MKLPVIHEMIVFRDTRSITQRLRMDWETRTVLWWMVLLNSPYMVWGEILSQYADSISKELASRNALIQCCQKIQLKLLHNLVQLSKEFRQKTVWQFH